MTSIIQREECVGRKIVKKEKSKKLILDDGIAYGINLLDITFEFKDLGDNDLENRLYINGVRCRTKD